MCTINFVEADVPHVAAERQRRRSLSAGRRLSDLEMLKKVRILFILFMYIKESFFANNAHTWLVLFSLARIHCNEIPMHVFLFWELRGLSPNFHIHASVSDLYIPRIGPYIFLQKNRWWKYINRSQTHECGNWDWLHNFFSGNICFEFSALVLCSVWLKTKKYFLYNCCQICRYCDKT
jgi:hypothetical protein